MPAPASFFEFTKPAGDPVTGENLTLIHSALRQAGVSIGADGYVSLTLRDGNGNLTPGGLSILGSAPRLGVGVAAPTEALHVAGNGLYTGNVTAVNLSASGTVTSALGVYVGGFSVISSGRVLQNVTAAAGIITSGTFADARLSTNIPRLASQNAWSSLQQLVASTNALVLATYGALTENPAYTLRRDGAMTWGQGGASAADTNLYRSAAGILRTDNTFMAGTFRLQLDTFYSDANVISYLTPFGSAVGAKFGSLVVSSTYTDTAPTNGLHVQGPARLAGGVVIGAQARQAVGGLLMEISGNADWASTQAMFMLSSSTNIGRRLRIGVNGPGTNAFIQAADDGVAGMWLLLNPQGGAVVVGAQLTPLSDNLSQLGASDRRWTAVYAVNGVIQTSTAVAKNIGERVTGAEALALARTVPVSRFTYREDAGYAVDVTTGAGGATRRVVRQHRHVGVALEDLPEWLRTTDNGVNPMNVAGVALAAVQGLDSIVSALADRVRVLETRAGSGAASTAATGTAANNNTSRPGGST